MATFSRETLEAISSWSEVFTTVFTVLLAFSGVGYLLSTRPLRKIEAREVQQERQKTAEAQKEAAQAQLALKQYVDVVAKSVNPRHIDPKRFLELLNGKPKGTAEIWYEPNDEQAREFASDLHRWLGPGGAGWSVLELKPFPKKAGRDGHLIPFEIIKRSAASTGLVLVCKKLSLNLDSTQHVLTNAINLSVGGWGIAGFEWSYENPTLPDDHFVIVVGHHQVNLPLVTFAPPKQDHTN
jgi:hypothetical protein